MANANWSNPTLTSTYTSFVSEVKNRDEDLALQFDGTSSTYTNLPVGTIRWDSSAGRWKKWTGSAWGELAATYALTTLTTTGPITGSSTVTGTALIPSGSSVPTNGIYLPSANSLGIATNSTQRALFDSSGNVTFNGNGSFAGDLTLKAQADVRFNDADNSNWVALQAPANVASNVTWTLPATDGTSGQVLSTNGSAVLSWVNGANADYQEFTSNGTWTKPAGCSTVYVELVGGGAGGGSGARYATTSARCGGGGGAGGAGLTKFFRASDLTASVSITVGAGGAGGIALTADSTNGNAGTAGGDTQFGTYLTSDVAGGGNGGTTSTTAVGGTASFRVGGSINGSNGGAGSATSAYNGSQCSFPVGGSGGGGGAGRTASTTTTLTGGNGGFNAFLRTANTTAGPGANATHQSAGGGGGSYTTAVAGMNGGNGAFPGGGGGGGSASDNGFTSGAGGSGAAGVVRIWSW